MATITMTIERGDEDDWRELTVEVSGTVIPYLPARTYGPPELCPPAEGGEVEDIEVRCATEDVELTDDELARAIEALEELAEDDIICAREERQQWQQEF